MNVKINILYKSGFNEEYIMDNKTDIDMSDKGYENTIKFLNEELIFPCYTDGTKGYTKFTSNGSLVIIKIEDTSRITFSKIIKEEK